MKFAPGLVRSPNWSMAVLVAPSLVGIQDLLVRGYPISMLIAPNE